jgi:hypothetical protein
MAQLQTIADRTGSDWLGLDTSVAEGIGRLGRIQDSSKFLLRSNQMCCRKRTTDRRFCGDTCRSHRSKQANRSFSSLLLQANLRINSRHCCVGLSACGVDLEQGSDPLQSHCGALVSLGSVAASGPIDGKSDGVHGAVTPAPLLKAIRPGVRGAQPSRKVAQPSRFGGVGAPSGSCRPHGQNNISSATWLTTTNTYEARNGTNFASSVMSATAIDVVYATSVATYRPTIGPMPTLAVRRLKTSPRFAAVATNDSTTLEDRADPMKSSLTRCARIFVQSDVSKSVSAKSPERKPKRKQPRLKEGPLDAIRMHDPRGKRSRHQKQNHNPSTGACMCHGSDLTAAQPRKISTRLIRVTLASRLQSGLSRSHCAISSPIFCSTGYGSTPNAATGTSRQGRWNDATSRTRRLGLGLAGTTTTLVSGSGSRVRTRSWWRLSNGVRQRMRFVAVSGSSEQRAR